MMKEVISESYHLFPVLCDPSSHEVVRWKKVHIVGPVLWRCMRTPERGSLYLQSQNQDAETEFLTSW